MINRWENGMNTRVSATKARVHFGEILRRVENNETITVERAGEPKAVIISIEEYDRLRDEAQPVESWQKQLERTQERFLREARDVDYDVNEIIRTMREERSEELYEDLC